MIPLPEVRIEEPDERPDESKLREVSRWLQDHQELAQVVSERRGRIVVKPRSNDPVDALEIANRVAEEVGPQMAQARFLRRTARPS